MCVIVLTGEWDMACEQPRDPALARIEQKSPKQRKFFKYLILLHKITFYGKYLARVQSEMVLFFNQNAAV